MKIKAIDRLVYDLMNSNLTNLIIFNNIDNVMRYGCLNYL